MHTGHQPTPPTFLRSGTTALETANALPQALAQRVKRWSATFDYRAMTTLTTADGQFFNPSIRVESRREDHDLDLMFRVIEATATGPNGSTIADCSFYTCRRPRTKPAMDADWIAEEMDNISAAAGRMGATLLEVDEFNLEHYVNSSSLVVADRVQVLPEFRDTSFWKELFALSLRHALEPRVPVPEFGYLHAFPLEFEGRVDGNQEAFAHGTRRLQHLYSKSLGARELAAGHSTGCYMTFPIQATG